ncbi:MAG: hypothetical protein WC384_17940 [Prolixibacteraceae bacterium]|jgi:hypothetical protein
MKKLAMLSMTVFFAASFVQVQAKEGAREVLKSEIENSRKEIKTERKEMRNMKENSVSDFSKRAFSIDFGDAQNVTWKKALSYDEADFTESGQEMKAYYDPESNLVGTTSFKTFADIPANAQTEIKRKYKNYTVDNVVYFDDNEDNDTDMIFGDNLFEDADNYFVELSNHSKKIILQVNPEGEIFFFKQL